MVEIWGTGILVVEDVERCTKFEVVTEKSSAELRSSYVTQSH